MANEGKKLPVGIENFEEIRTEGFYYIDKTGFTRKFKANFGMTPMEYRRYRQGNLAED